MDVKRSSTPFGQGHSSDRASSSLRRRRSRDLVARILSSLKRRSQRASGAEVRRAISLCHTLLTTRGEVSGMQLAAELLAVYRSLDADDRAAFFDALVNEFSPSAEAVRQSADAYVAEPSEANLMRLQHVVEPTRRELFRRMAKAPDGVAALVQMRRALLVDLEANARWHVVDADFVHLFKSWFNRGFLELRQIDWRTSAAVLEKLIAYEAVHQIQGWHDLRRRLQADRRCYAFFHHALPEEPIIFIEVALTHGVSSEVQPLLDPDLAVSDGKTADSAIFYSISNCQEGLRGVPFGHLVVKQVVENLQRELPRLKTFATLSPIPGFRRWLLDQAASCGSPPLTRLLAHLEQPEWWKQNGLANELKAELIPLCAHYLLYGKRGTNEPYDAVERFHLRNGARLHRVNWLGDTSHNGIVRAAGLTVNYVYDLTELERNHESYARDLKVIASRTLERLARASLLHTSSENPTLKTGTETGPGQ